MTKMKTVKPDYYDEFVCIADRCPYTCCREWKIAVDEDTYSDWRNLATPSEVMDSDLADADAAGRVLADYAEGDKGDRAIRLNADKICPLLNDCGLCNVVIRYGERALSKTCHTFPRESRDYLTRREQDLAIGCPAVLDLLWSRQSYACVAYDEAGCAPGDIDSDEELERRLFKIRDLFVGIMQDRTYTPELALKMCFYMGLEYYKDINAEVTESFIKDLAEGIQGLERDYYDHICEQNELLLDLAENYRNKGIYNDVLGGICEQAEDYEAFARRKKFIKRREAFEGVWTGMEDKIRLLLNEELFATLVMPEEEMYGVLIKLEWLGIFLAALKESLFLYWDIHNGLDYDAMRDITVVLARMTGYSDEDVEEYLENSFEDVIWEFGYMGLII